MRDKKFLSVQSSWFHSRFYRNSMFVFYVSFNSFLFLYWSVFLVLSWVTRFWLCLWYEFGFVVLMYENVIMSANVLQLIITQWYLSIDSPVQLNFWQFFFPIEQTQWLFSLCFRTVILRIRCNTCLFKENVVNNISIFPKTFKNVNSFLLNVRLWCSRETIRYYLSIVW